MTDNPGSLPKINEFHEGPGFERPEHFGEPVKEPIKRIFDDWAKQSDVPRRTDVSEDGREVVIIGDVEKFKEYNHEQGQNEFGFLGTCGLVSCEDILRQFGKKVTETDIVKYAIEHHFCATEPPRGDQGGTTVLDQVAILEGHGVPAGYDTGLSLDDLAARVESGKGVITEVNAYRLWDQKVPAFYYRAANHAIVVTGVQRDAKTGKINGFYINDSGNFDHGNGSGRFVDAKKFQKMWVDVGGTAVTTKQPVPR